METIWKGKQTNKQTSRGGMCGGADAGGSAELHSMQSLVHNTSEYVEELWRCIGDALEKCRVRYAGSYSDNSVYEDYRERERIEVSKPFFVCCNMTILRVNDTD